MRRPPRRAAADVSLALLNLSPMEEAAICRLTGHDLGVVQHVLEAARREGWARRTGPRSWAWVIQEPVPAGSAVNVVA